jgi:ribonuclease G
VAGGDAGEGKRNHRLSAELLVNVTPRETRVAVIENGMLQETFIERANRRGLVGNIYKGCVCRVLPGMQAAFVDIGLERAAFLHASDIVGASEDPADEGTPDPADTQHIAQPNRPPFAAQQARAVKSITDLVHDGQEVLVQVIKDPLGTKGARLTTHISIPSCYLVYMPGAGTIGVSQRIEEQEERTRLRDLGADIRRRRTGANQSDGEAENDSALTASLNGDGYIVRTAAESASEELMLADMDFLAKLWASVTERTREAKAPDMVHEDLPLVIRTLRELTGTEIERARVDSRETMRKLVDFTERFVPEMVDSIEHYTGDRPIFDIYGVEDEIQKALGRKVQLKSGGHLIIDQTEAMTTIDINTGAYVGHRNLEETIFKTNLEASQAIARQLRLRNLGGIIIIDFIDMRSEEHKRQVLRALEKSLDRDHTKTHISDVSALGLVQMTRKRTRESLEHVLCDPCPTCSGRGSIKTADTVCYEIFREILREARQFDTEKLLVIASQEVIDTLVDDESASFAELEAFIGKPITLQVETLYSREHYDVVLM